MAEKTIEIQTERMSYGPAAVARAHLDAPTDADSRPMVVFVAGAAPGERVRARITRRHKNYCEAELVEVLEPSADRAKPPCPIYDQCGGCQWQHLTYPAQLRSKREILIHQLAKATRIAAEELDSKLEVHGAANPFGYRARLQAHGDSKGLGFFAAASHDIAHTDRCVVAHPDIQKAWSDFLATRPLAELAKATGQFKVEWSLNDRGQIQEAINRKHGVFGFTQINPEQNKVLVDVVTRLAIPVDAQAPFLLDLFGGNGNLSLGLSSSFKRIVCVDTDNDGLDASVIATPLKQGHTLVRDEVERFLTDQRLRDWDIGKVDCVISDPPRTGMRDAAPLIRDLHAQRIVLVSCDPSTLARDLVVFIQGGYEITDLHLVDMFPQTYHLEAVVGLTRR